ncbi:MAG: cation:proton antiporter, partial [Lentisphaeria bacterium]|nr:cation:proton antiporter [Lentisphaeria bacterium]
MKENISLAVEIAVLAIQIGVILFAARLCGNLFRKLHIPPVLGELFAGVVIGPYLLGAIPLGLHGLGNGLFPLYSNGLPVSVPLYAFATFGSIILLFVSGLETDLRQFFRYSVTGSLVGIGGAAVSYLFGAWLGVWMFNTSMLDPRVLFLGILSTATSVGITARILSERKSIDSPEGTTILAAAVIDDVLGIICLAVVMGIVGTSSANSSGVDWEKIGFITIKSIGVWLGATALGLLCAHKIAKFLKFFRPGINYSILAFGAALIAAGLFEEAGLAMIIGAYIAGLSLSKTDIAFAIQRNIQPVYNFMVPIFFVVMGMMIDIRVFTDMTVLKYGMIYSILAILAKIIGCAIPARLLKFNTVGALRIGAGMIPRGEVALIIAGIGATTMMTLDGAKVPIINAELFGIAIIMTLVTTVAAPPILTFVLNIKKSGIKNTAADISLTHTIYKFPSEIIRDFVLHSIREHFRIEGFRNSAMTGDGGIIHFRKEKTTFTLYISEGTLDFESDRACTALIKSVMFETFAEIQQTIAELKEFTRSDNAAMLKPPSEFDANEILQHFNVQPEQIITAE